MTENIFSFITLEWLNVKIKIQYLGRYFLDWSVVKEEVYVPLFIV